MPFLSPKGSIDIKSMSPNTDIPLVFPTRPTDNTFLSDSNVPIDNIVLSELFFLGQYHFVFTTPSPTWDINVLSMTPLTLFLDVLLFGQHRCFHAFEPTRQERRFVFIILVYDRSSPLESLTLSEFPHKIDLSLRTKTSSAPNTLGRLLFVPPPFLTFKPGVETPAKFVIICAFGRCIFQVINK
jgi:hypothetical protein